MRELENLLPELAPPHGGAARLRQRIAAADARRRRTHRALRWSAALALPALVLAALLPAPLARWQHTRALTQAMREVMQPPVPAPGLTVAHGVAWPLPSGQANVRLYLVQTDATPEPGPRPR